MLLYLFFLLNVHEHIIPSLNTIKIGNKSQFFTLNIFIF